MPPGRSDPRPPPLVPVATEAGVTVVAHGPDEAEIDGAVRSSAWANGRSNEPTSAAARSAGMGN